MSLIRHEKQIEFMDDQSRFKFLLAGRRGGKTKGMVEKMVEDIHNCPPKGTVFYIGPTLGQAMELVWEDLDDRFDQLGWKYRPLISRQRFEFSRRRRLQVIGAEKIRRIRGRMAFSVYGDEVAFWETDLFKAWRAIRPSLTDLAGSATFATTPDGKGSPAYVFYRSIMEPRKKRGSDDFVAPWKYFEWTTLDNPFMDQDEIEDARNELDEKSFRQEYEAKWESFEGLAYYSFDEGLHISRESIQKVDESKPIGLTFDFNVNPTTVIVNQEAGDSILFRREYSQKNSSTPATVKSFISDHAHLAGKCLIEIYGDSTGSNRKSNTGYSDYHYVFEELTAAGFQYRFNVPAVNPSIIDRVAHSNGFLKNTKGVSRILIDPSCKDLITDLASQKLEGRFPSDAGNLGHKADAFGYRIWWKYLMTQTGKSDLTRIV